MAALDDSEESRLDLVPMIDTIMLLLLFFILTTKFSAEEKVISSLLPTEKGTGPSIPPVIPPPEEVNVIITPEGFAPGEKGIEALDTRWKANCMPLSATLRITGSPATLALDGKLLEERPSPKQQAHIDEIHRFVAQNLSRFETPASTQDRKKTPGVIVNCFSGLSYKYALVAYDAIRGYESQYSGKGLDNLQLQKAREVSFAAPRIRNYHVWELGQELFEQLGLK